MKTTRQAETHDSDAATPRMGLTRSQTGLKRAFDVATAAVGLGVTFWIVALTWIVATIDTGTNGFFTQERIGRGGRRFRVIKLRTMRTDASKHTNVTTSTDARITRAGRLFRRTKLDELPQLINVLKGDMSLVGPRPDVPGFADELTGEDRVILSVRPGITGPATLKYRDEEALLAGAEDPERYNRDVLWPDKVRVNRDYVQQWSFRRDLVYIWRTIIE